MRDKIGKVLQSKSYTGIFDIFESSPFNNVHYRPKNMSGKKEDSATQGAVGDTEKISSINDSVCLNQTPFVTSEKYHGLNKNLSNKSVVRSTSTIFYDLDDIAKRHSFHCLTEVSVSNANILKVMKLPINSVFEGKSNAIVQECATQIHPKIVVKDSIEINLKKTNKNTPKNDILSSEIFLSDNRFRKPRKNQYFNIDIKNQQKFWSYAKYRTEYTKPTVEDKKSKKKDKGKRTEDPCPCQLFSYACPCTDEKSLTELAKNSKCLTVIDQITSTTIIISEAKKNKAKKQVVRQDKPTNTNVTEKTEGLDPKPETIIQVAEKSDIPQLADSSSPEKSSSKCKSSSRKKPRKMICPNCKEKVDAISFTEEEGSLKYDSKYGSKELSSTAAYNCSTSSRSYKNKADDEDICHHEPRCELIPVCQILPTDEAYLNPNCTKKRTLPKNTPRVIRITKACRHHPPCTVVPSCQRANVLRNNCEFIPPCLHRPRCVNLPLCVPLSKSIHYDQLLGRHDEMQNMDCPHVPKCKLIPVCQHDSLSNNIEQHYNVSSRVQNVDYTEGYQTSAFMVKPPIICNTPSPGMTTIGSPCCSCKSNKSCQFNCPDCNYHNNSNMTKGSVSTDAVIFIRDVGCQFQNKPYSPKDSVLHSKTSSASFDFVNIKSGNYYTTNVHTMRCQDKFTNPIIAGDELSTDSIVSVEIDSHCPSHGRRSKNQCSGFNAMSSFVTAFADTNSILPSIVMKRHKDISKPDLARYRETFPVKSRRSFLKGRYRKIFAGKQRWKSKTSSHLMSTNSKTAKKM